MADFNSMAAEVEASPWLELLQAKVVHTNSVTAVSGNVDFALHSKTLENMIAGIEPNSSMIPDANSASKVRISFSWMENALSELKEVATAWKPVRKGSHTPVG